MNQLETQRFNIRKTAGPFLLSAVCSLLCIKPAQGLTPATICDDSTLRVCGFLNQQWSQGLAAGNAGDYYQNADGGHTNLGYYANIRHPQIFQNGILPVLNGGTLQTFPGKVVVGNASYVYYLPNGHASVPRYLYLSNQFQASAGYQQYQQNDAFWYVSGDDFCGPDRFQALAPFVNTAIGYSGTELGDVDQYLWTLAAFRPDTKALLTQKGLLMPTIEMIMRRARVASDADYLSPNAHFSYYPSTDVALPMAQMANAITADSVPPMVQIGVLNNQDTYQGCTSGVTCFDNLTYEKLFDTPVAIARYWRSFDAHKRIQLTAEASYDVNGRPLTYQWVLIRGDPAHVKFTYLNGSHSQVQIDLDWHPAAPYPDPNPADGTGQCQSNLVVVAAFANNGAYYSAPAFFTSYTDPSGSLQFDGAGRILQENNTDGGFQVPTLGINKHWTGPDVFNYDVSSNLTGWTRHDYGMTYQFTPEGYNVTATDAKGNPTMAQRVVYVPGSFGLDWNPVGNPFPYVPGQPAPTEISVSPATASDGPGGDAYFTATVVGPSNTAVAWTLNPPGLGRLLLGGPNTVDYFAPATLNTQQRVQVIATSVADPRASASATITLTPATSAPVITSSPTAAGTVSSSFTYQITATNSPTSFNAMGLPAGLSVNKVNGLISGVPLAVGTSSVTLSATNASGTGTSLLILTINPAPAPPPQSSTGTVIVTADNEYSAYANGNQLGTGSNWQAAQTYNFPVSTGTNVVAIAGITWGSHNPAGVLADLQAAGLHVGTGAAWKLTTTQPPANWTDPAFDDSSWASAFDEAPYGSGVWGHSRVAGMPAATPAHWIWSCDTNGACASNVPVNVWIRYKFQGSGAVPPPSTSGTLTVTADNLYTAYFDDAAVDQGSNWMQAQSASVSIVSGKNVLAMSAANQGGPAGALADLAVAGQHVGTTASCRVLTTQPPANWTAVSFDDSSWPNAFDEGAYGSGPWAFTTVAGMPANTPAHWIWSCDTVNDSTCANANQTATIWLRCSFNYSNSQLLLQDISGAGPIAAAAPAPSVRVRPNPFRAARGETPDHL